MTEENKMKWEPFWTSDVKIESGGRYPLGLNHFHNHLDTLINRNIVYNADKLHYITFYCWAIGDINKNEKCNSYADFVSHFQLRENIFSFGLYINEHDYSVNGSTKLSELYNPKKEEYDLSFRLMKSNALGAYGLYYSGAIFGFGFINIDKNGIPALTDSGKNIYKFADKILSKTQYYKSYKGKKNVPVKIIKQFGEANDLYRIRKRDSIDERNIYKKKLFHLDLRSPEYRRDTFTLYLHLIEECQKKNVEFHNESFFNIIYFNKYHTRLGKTVSFEILKIFHDVQFYWKLYFGHSLFRRWLSEYFGIFLSFLKECNNGATIDEFIKYINIDNFNTTIELFLKNKRDYFNSKIESITKILGNNIDFSDSYSEFKVHFDKKQKSNSSKIAKMILIFICLFIRFESMKKDHRFINIIAQLEGDLWFGKLFVDFPDIDKIDLKKFLIEILSQYIINQHENIMYQKNDLRRCWFTLENERYFFQADNSPLWGDGHYNTVMSYLFDMNLIDYEGDDVYLSREGRELYEKLMKEYYSNEIK